MEYFIICLAAFLSSGLTLFSGFGLGTLLVPVFALFFPIDIAIALTAVVHFLNNLFKLSLLGKYADKGVVLRFGLPAILTAFLGAKLLLYLTDIRPIAEYTLFGNEFQITPVKVVVAILIIVFSLFDLVPVLTKISFNRKYLSLGGLLSGFFGGLSGNQGALRSTFLIKAGLSKETYIATGVVIACIVDISRIMVYAQTFRDIGPQLDYMLLALVTLFAFAGAYIGNKLVKKITIHTLQVIVAVVLLLIAIGLGLGLI